jgi:hypothetical protein
VLGIASGTAKLHVSAVIEALDVTNRTEATTRLHELDLGAVVGETPPDFTVPDFGARPAIAVLPFENFSNDPAQDFLAVSADGRRLPGVPARPLGGHV